MLLRTLLYFDNSNLKIPQHATSQIVGIFLHALRPTRSGSVGVFQYVNER